MFIAFLALSFVSAIYGQATSCADAGTGPCLNNVCPVSGQQCLTSPAGGQVCCSNPALPTTTAATCVDKINPSTGTSDCPRMATYCNNSAYYDLMTQQCPKNRNYKGQFQTCGRCSGTATTTASTCVDKVNPTTGVSDCSNRLSYCNNSFYRTLMMDQISL